MRHDVEDADGACPVGFKLHQPGRSQRIIQSLFGKVPDRANGTEEGFQFHSGQVVGLVSVLDAIKELEVKVELQSKCLLCPSQSPLAFGREPLHRQASFPTL